MPGVLHKGKIRSEMPCSCPTLGSMILYALSSMEWQPATLLKMRSSLTFSLGGSQLQDDLTGDMEADAGLGD